MCVEEMALRETECAIGVLERTKKKHEKPLGLLHI